MKLMVVGIALMLLVLAVLTHFLTDTESDDTCPNEHEHWHRPNRCSECARIRNNKPK